MGSQAASSNEPVGTTSKAKAAAASSVAAASHAAHGENRDLPIVRGEDPAPEPNELPPAKREPGLVSGLSMLREGNTLPHHVFLTQHRYHHVLQDADGIMTQILTAGSF